MLNLLFAIAVAQVSGPTARPPAVSVVGTWKLNVTKSRFTPGPGWRSQLRTYTLQPDGGVLVKWTGVGAKGEAMQVSFVSKLDGKDYPMKGSANYDTLNAVAVDAFTVKSEEKRDRKVVGVAMRTISADGQVMTITDHGTNRNGEKFSQVLVFDRQR